MQLPADKAKRILLIFLCFRNLLLCVNNYKTADVVPAASATREITKGFQEKKKKM